MKLNQFKQVGNQTVCLFGPPKSGKSLLAGKLAEHFKVIWFDLENGASVLLQLPVEWQERIELIQIPDTRTFPIAIETMMKVLKGSEVQICERHGKVSCALCKQKNEPTVRVCLNEIDLDTIVVIDSGTQLTNSVMANIARDKDVDYKFEWDDWAKVGTTMDWCLSHIQQARYNVVYITHEAEVELEDGKSKLVPVSGTARFSRNTAKYFGHVVYCEVKNKGHRATSSTTAAVNLLTGSRTGVALENGELTLLRIFKPELYPDIEPMQAGNVNTQGAAAVDKLAALRAKLGGGGK